MSRADDVAMWHEVNRTVIGLTGVVEMYANGSAAPTPMDSNRGPSARPTRSPSVRS